jgi:hypothetical protein
MSDLTQSLSSLQAEGSEPPPAKRARTGDAEDDRPLPPPEHDEPEHDWSASVCYLCELTPTNGKFDLVSLSSAR